jgi:hypothetical protein
MGDSEEEEEELDIKSIPDVLSKVPPNYHKNNFYARSVVVDIMKSNDVNKELMKLEQYCKKMDAAMNAIVNGNDVFHLLSSLLKTTLSHIVFC